MWGSGGIAQPFLIPALDVGEQSTSRPGRFIPAERIPGTHWIGGYVDRTAGPEAVEYKKNLLTLLGIEPRPSSP
jgi:hypothetical protein